MKGFDPAAFLPSKRLRRTARFTDVANGETLIKKKLKYDLAF